MSPRKGRILHLAFAAFWAAQMVGCVLLLPLDWRLYLLEISLWANFATHVAGWSAERPSEIVES